MDELRDEFKWYFALATKNAMYPYNAVLIPKIEAVANMIFQEDNFYAPNDIFAAKLLQCNFQGIIKC